MAQIDKRYIQNKKRHSRTMQKRVAQTATRDNRKGNGVAVGISNPFTDAPVRDLDHSRDLSTMRLVYNERVDRKSRGTVKHPLK
ncbi:hypothetical protein Rctr71_021 [Virus Rctr71]|nr:hypothetical protein Rctr71_021 [Virus Rctr71]